MKVLLHLPKWWKTWLKSINNPKVRNPRKGNSLFGICFIFQRFLYICKTRDDYLLYTYLQFQQNIFTMNSKIYKFNFIRKVSFRIWGYKYQTQTVDVWSYQTTCMTSLFLQHKNETNSDSVSQCVEAIESRRCMIALVL